MVTLALYLNSAFIAFIGALNISRELQEKRIKLTYPENYEDHLKNIDHLSEKNEFNFKSGYPHLTINSDDYTKESLKELIINFLEKNVF